ncbi:MAG: hypothetical protein JOZ73_09965, partial [Solirubrobacterales bacterium]|nr:hypothetical protein [Solirubrobacterales bacterium]
MILLAAMASGLGGSCDTSWTNAAGGDWNTASNWDNGVPTGSSNACITLSGTYTVTIRGESVPANTLSLGGSTGEQTLSIQGTDFCSGSADAKLALGNGGTVASTGQIMLTHLGSCSNGVPVLASTAGTLTNSGTIDADPGSSNDNRYLQGNLTNAGILAVNAKTLINAAGTLDNKGGLTIASGQQLTVSSGAGASVVNDAGGSIDNGGNSGYMFVDGGNTFTEGAGTTNPSAINPTNP